MFATFSFVYVFGLDNTYVTLVFKVVSHRVPKVYYIYYFLVLTCGIQSDEPKHFGSQQFYDMFIMKRKT